MKKTSHTIGALAGALSLFGAAQALAVPNITVADFAPTYNGFLVDGDNSKAGNINIAGLNVAKEDNETERGGNTATYAGQQWDLEAFIVANNSLYMVAGYDFLNGMTDNGRPGDLFIKVGGAQPLGDPNTTSTLNVNNSLYSYNFAVDLSLGSYNNNGTYNSASAFGPTANVYSLTSNTVLSSVLHDDLLSNPWKVNNALNTVPTQGQQGVLPPTIAAVTQTNITYTTGLTSAQVQSLLGYSFAGTYHNILKIDLSFLGTLTNNNPVWFSYTMECGNDSMKGKYTVPEGGTTIGLIGVSLVALAFGVQRRRRA